MGADDMARPQKTYNTAEKTMVENAYKASRDTKEQKRLLCIKLRVLHGKTASEIANITDYTLGTVKTMLSTYGKEGLQPFLYKRREGNYRKMSKQVEKEVLDTFEQKATAGSILIISEIHKAFFEKAGEPVSLSTVYNIMARHGWRKVMPRSKHPKKASDEDIDAYKKNDR